MLLPFFARLKKSPEEEVQESPSQGRRVTQRSTAFRLRKRMLPGFYFDLFARPEEEDYLSPGEMRSLLDYHLLNKKGSSSSAYRLR